MRNDDPARLILVKAMVRLAFRGQIGALALKRVETTTGEISVAGDTLFYNPRFIRGLGQRPIGRFKDLAANAYRTPDGFKVGVIARMVAEAMQGPTSYEHGPSLIP